AGAVIMNPRTFCVHDLKMVEEHDHTRYYKEAFFSKEKWLRLLKGEVDVRRTVAALAPKVKKIASGYLRKLMSWNGDPGSKETTNNVPECLRAMAERGVDTLLLATVPDPGVDYVDAHFGTAMRSLACVDNFRRVDIQGTDHTFTSIWSQGYVTDTIADHL